jgi:hypothetical protein
MSLSDIFFYFLFMFSAGTLFFLPLVDSRLTGAAHSKLTSAVSATSSLLASFGLGLMSFKFSLILCITFTHALFALFIYLYHQDERSLLIKIFYVCTLILGLFFIAIIPVSWHDRGILLCSMMLLGVVNYTMILGHYYLVVPKLTVRPLLWGLRIYWFMLIVKIIILFPYSSILTLWHQAFEALAIVDSNPLTTYDVSELSLFFFHQLSEYVALPIISFFAYKLCLIRSTQSATGLFYVMVFFALISEMLSVYFLLIRGMGI